MLYMLMPVQGIVIEAAFWTKILPMWIDLNFHRVFPFAQLFILYRLLFLSRGGGRTQARTLECKINQTVLADWMSFLLMLVKKGYFVEFYTSPVFQGSKTTTFRGYTSPVFQGSKTTTFRGRHLV